ncbi:MAG TPA: adenylate/guanylate cyclase domain-containing protein [Gaiellaceae bacterium]|jgi:class 3 adenylate cyclase/tetratricopeptide (TPR) repeat protein|nr:adenylate/guanylate cyclase domain-containing protein [Gaiellaceae bacterium]
MERKLATVLFVDLVDSTRLVTGADPEVVRRRVTQYFEKVAHCVDLHGGIVEKFAGDAVMAAFGVTQAHEDDAQRAARAALAIRDAVDGLELQARIGIEAGEVVVESAESTFATGEAVNLAARLQEAARPGEILVGPTAYRLAAASLVVEDGGMLDLKGIDGPMRAWRVMDMLDGPGRPVGPRAPLVGRESELELLENTFSRSVRDSRAHLFTIYGEPGVGKSRLAREFVDGVERASVLVGRALPYGEGVTYWPLGEMVKAAAGISDDDPLEEAFAKLRECCAEEAVADVLGLAAGLMEALDGERSPQEIAWGAREVMQGIADVQPLILLFEDIHWAEPPLLDLIEHLADWVRAPLLILCIARAELLEARPDWGGGRVRSTSIELEPLSEEESAELVEQLLSQLTGTTGELPANLPQEALDRAEGNPLFVEETIRMLVESGSGAGSAARVPDSLQALIAARIDHLPPDAKTLLQRGSVIGRVFWKGALEHLAPDIGEHEQLLENLLQREFLLREPRSSISGEVAYRFKHALIREVAYTGMAKLARAQYHARFAEWLHGRTGEELVEIRAYHLDQSVEFLTELEGAAPEELAEEAASALVKAAKRAIAREAYANARTLGLRALELRPTLSARYVAARAAWRLQDWGAVQLEMMKVRDQAREHDEPVIEALALTALGEAALKRDGDAVHARTLVDDALRILGGQSDPDAHFDALTARAMVGVWLGSEDEAVQFMERAYVTALDAGRKDLQTIAAQALAQTHIIRLELDEAELLLTRALELAGESGSVRARLSATLAYAWFLRVKGELDAAETMMEEVRATAEEFGMEPVMAGALMKLGWAARQRGDLKRSEKLFREALRITASRGDRGLVPDFQAALATTLADLGKVDEGERLALDARAHAVPEDTGGRIFAATALAAIRGAQGRDDEAEEMFLSAIADARESNLKLFELHPLERLTEFLNARGRDDDAAIYEARMAELSPATDSRTERIA